MPVQSLIYCVADTGSPLLISIKSSSSGMEEPASSQAPDPPLNVRQPKSIVHEYFEPTVVYNKKKKLDVEGSICNDCGKVFSSQSSSTLKGHLQKYHEEAHDEMLSKYEI